MIDAPLDERPAAPRRARLHRRLHGRDVAADDDEVLARADGPRQQQLDARRLQHRVLGQVAGRDRRDLDQSDRSSASPCGLLLRRSRFDDDGAVDSRTTPSMLAWMPGAERACGAAPPRGRPPRRGRRAGPAGTAGAPACCLSGSTTRARRERPILERPDVVELRQAELRHQPLHRRRAAIVGERMRLDGRRRRPSRCSFLSRATGFAARRRSSGRGPPGRSRGCTGCTRSSTACPRSSATCGSSKPERLHRAVRLDRVAEQVARAQLRAEAALVAGRPADALDLPAARCRYRATSGCEAGSTTMPPVVLVTGSSRLAASRPIITPPSRTPTSATVAPPAASIDLADRACRPARAA